MFNAYLFISYVICNIMLMWKLKLFSYFVFLRLKQSNCPRTRDFAYYRKLEIRTGINVLLNKFCFFFGGEFVSGVHFFPVK